MDFEIKKLIDNGTIICGRIIQENGILRFERIEPSQIEDVPEEERGYATASMGRAIFNIGKDGTIHNFKGVDSHLATSELGPMDLVNARSIEYAPRTDSYKVSAVVFNDKKPEIRIKGTSPLEDIEIEGDINKRLAQMGIKVPTISHIREIPQDFSIKYGLPIKVAGSLDEFESDYAVEDDERKKRLAEIYGSNYLQELEKNQRPESMREYLQRIGFLSSPEVQANIESLGYSMQDFIEAVDSSYSRGQRYGQAERIMGSPFRISDLETYIENGNKEQLQAIMDFSEMQNNNFTEQLAKIFGKNIATLMNNGWECENLIHRQDFSLTGEFCDDSYFNIFEKQEEMKEKYKAEPYKADALFGEIRRKFTGQVMHIASCIKVVQNAMLITGRSQEEVDSVLDKFIESFTNNLDLQKIGNLFQIDEKGVEETLMSEFRVGQNWTEKMAGQDRKEGFVMDEAIYNSHIENEDFYAKVSGMITERIKNRQNQKYGLEDTNGDILNKWRITMKITLESITMNRKKYEANIEKILQDRTGLMKQVTELRKRKEQLTDKKDILKLEFDEAGLVQEINDLTYSYRINKLVLEQLQIQQEGLEKKIDRITFTRRILENKEAKDNLGNEKEFEYDKNEITKCEKAIELYTLLGDKENIEKWQKKLETAQNNLEFIQDEINTRTQSKKEDVEKTDTEKETTDEINAENNNGHTLQFDEKGSVEKWKNVVKDDSNKEIGTRDAVEIEEYATGRKKIDVTTELENEDGKYTIREHSEGTSNEYKSQKIVEGFNKLTGNNEKFCYSKDQDGNEFAYSEINGKTGLRVSKTSRGTTIDIYDENGQIKDSFEYDSEGKAIMGFDGLDELPEDYVEKFIQRTARNIPNYYIEGMQQENDEQQSILDSAIEATEDNTRTGEINEEVQNIKRRQIEKEQQQSMENDGINR